MILTSYCGPSLTCSYFKPSQQVATNAQMSKVQTLVSLLQGCNSMQKLQKIQAQVIVNGYQNEPSLSHKLLTFCAVSVAGSLNYAQILFNQTQNPQISHWNSMIRAYSQSPFPLESIFLYNKMIKETHSRPDTFTFSFLLKACEKSKCRKKCREAHGSIIRTGYLSNVTLCTNLIRAYAGNELIEAARDVFDGMPERDVVAWNAMISCYSQVGLHDEALKIYEKMKVLGVSIDEFTVVVLLSACAHVGALDIGIWLHEFSYISGFGSNVFVGNALIDMYAKCGSLDGARMVFSKMRKRDVFTWNSMIMGLGVHGFGDEANLIFRQMLRDGVRPNSITFLGLLCGCSHQGLIAEGVEYFRMMNSEFNIKPGVKHYGCMVDLFGRAGKLDGALLIIENSHFVDDPVLWRTLLSACKIHRNVEMGEVALRNLVQTKSANAGDCILLCGIYAEVGNKDGVAWLRKMIKDQGIKTTPGWSWIEVDGSVRKFVVFDKSHCDSKEIYQKLEEMIDRVRIIGYKEEESVAVPESNEELSANSSRYHSEKLALAFGLARTPEGTQLRIVKNLRVCRDCHSLAKFVSRAFDREIVVRDRVRFHHFKDGSCSCRDYW